MQGTEIGQILEENPTADRSKISEEGELGSDGENIEDVDADLKDLVSAKQSKALPASFIFGESKVTADLIREYEAAEFFPVGSGRAPLDEEIPTPEADEIVVFRDFFTCELRFDESRNWLQCHHRKQRELVKPQQQELVKPCDPLLPAILDKISV
jgi:hypothetical protein